MTHVKLLGELGEKFGTDWECSGNTFRDVIKLIECQTEGFAETLAEYVEKGIGLEVVNGDKLIETEEDAFELLLPILKDTVYITPIPQGSGSLGKIVAGIALMVAAPWAVSSLMTAGGGALGSSMWGAKLVTALGQAMTSLGVSLLMGGVTEMLAPDTPGESPDSYLFGNTEENMKQGSPVPICYGQLVVPGVVMNFGYIDHKLTTVPHGYTRVANGSINSAAGSGGGGGNGGGIGGGTPGIDDESYKWTFNLE